MAGRLESQDLGFVCGSKATNSPRFAPGFSTSLVLRRSICSNSVRKSSWPAEVPRRLVVVDGLTSRWSSSFSSSHGSSRGAQRRLDLDQSTLTQIDSRAKCFRISMPGMCVKGHVGRLQNDSIPRCRTPSLTQPLVSRDDLASCFSK